MSIAFIGDIILLLNMLIAIILFLNMDNVSKESDNKPTESKIKKPKFAILIPARDESMVIRSLLSSINAQTYKINMKDVYIIIENKSDPSNKIAKEFGAEVVIRKNLKLQRKGYALDEGVKHILKNGLSYDAYFIFDADNVLSPTFMEEMKKTFDAGYDIGMGYRNAKNGDDTAVSACSTLTFSMVNTLGNLDRNKKSLNITLSGTGFYIKGSILESWRGYPFHTLTEDYELTLYSVLNELTSFYNESAVFYDAQPTKMNVSITQRTRWIKGYFEAWKLYRRKLMKSSIKSSKNSPAKYIYSIAIIPYLLIVIGIIINLLSKIVASILLIIQDNPLYKFYLILFIIELLAIYIVLMLLTIHILHKEKGKLDLKLKSKIKASLFNPIFLASFVLCGVKAMVHKDLEWIKIEHT